MRRNALFARIFSLLALSSLLLAPAPVQAGTLADTEIKVTTTADELNSDGDCSLREALQAANTDQPVSGCPAGSGDDVIRIPPGTYSLSLVGAGEDLGLTGDLDINSNVTIFGAGSDLTIIDGNATDRIFHVTGKYQVNISYLTIRNGSVSEGVGGGGIFNYQGSLKLFKAAILNNTSSNTGGGLSFIGPGSAVLNEVNIANNNAVYGGGAYNGGGVILQVDSCTFHNNTATRSGGGLDNSGFATLNNTTFSSNTSMEGGGIFSVNNITSVNCTFNQNNLVAVFLGNAEMVFSNTIVANSTSGTNCQLRTGSPAAFRSEDNNLETADTCNFHKMADIINADPVLGPLQDNGGFTLTHALLNGSPAIDTGSNNNCMPLDQRGRLRPADGDEDLTYTCDIGSFEFNGMAPLFNFLPIALKQ